MMLLFGGSEKRAAKTATDTKRDLRILGAKDAFHSGKFPVLTTSTYEVRKVRLVRGLVSCRGFDHESSFYGMIAKSLDICADAILGYQENVAFHPDGTKYFSCYGTAVVLEKEKEK
jgi:hypothetical protein